jgi:hypothetical protein
MVSRNPGVPQFVVVAVVALGAHILWSWRRGNAHANERALALQALDTVPPNSIIVADAGFVGYEWLQAIRAKNIHFLIRVGSNPVFLTGAVEVVKDEGGRVWLWPQNQRDQAPVQGRLIRIERHVKQKRRRGVKRKQKKIEVMYLFTDILDEQDLTTREASQLYDLRWPGNEGNFRSWKCTLAKNKLVSRNAANSAKECDLSLLALMLLQILTLCAQRRKRKARKSISVARAARTWRHALGNRRAARTFRQQLRQAVLDAYHRTKPKSARVDVRCKTYVLMKPPRIRRLTSILKARAEKILPGIVAA